MDLYLAINVSCIVYSLRDKLNFVGEKGVSLLLGSVRKTNGNVAIADSRFGVQGSYFA